MNNGRTASAQEEYLAKNPTKATDFFTADPELWDAQAVQHDLLIEMSGQSDLRKYFEDPRYIKITWKTFNIDQVIEFLKSSSVDPNYIKLLN
jgi:hypothetical protein